MQSYSIDVTRGKNSGTLTYSGDITVSTTCWWDPKKKIPAQTYSGCSATTMTNKKNSLGKPREAIYFPNVSGFKGIFIHMGTSAAWSDGCVVIAEAEIKRIYNDILPKDGKNVTVTVRDQ